MNTNNRIIGQPTRQVVPADFSFLSEADSQIVELIWALMVGSGLITNADMGDKYPIIISGLEMSESGTSEGMVLYKKRIYHFDATEQHGMASSAAKYCFKKELSAVAPSPVRDKNGVKNVSVHYQSECWIPDLATDVDINEWDIYYLVKTGNPTDRVLKRIQRIVVSE